MAPQLRSLAAALLLTANAAASASTLVVFDAAAPRFEVLPSYVSFNVDSASITNGFDFSDPVLSALVANLAKLSPTYVRIGGGTGDDTCFTGADGPAGNCTYAPWCTTCVNEAYVDAIAGFAASSGAALTWDVNTLVDRFPAMPPAGVPLPAWNGSNAFQLLDYITSKGYAKFFTAWQLGNEPELFAKHRNLTLAPSQLAADYHTLKARLASTPGVTPYLIGPSACCDGNGSFLLSFLDGAKDVLAALDFHIYPIPRGANSACETQLFTNVTAFGGSLVRGLQQYSSIRDTAAPGLPLILGETATTAQGGCPTWSNSFVSSFEWLVTLGVTGEQGVSQINRQDIAGFSGPPEPSQYSLAGPPGWVSGSAALGGAVHPDYFVALLWKQLVGTRVLRSSFSLPSAAAADTLDLHVWCAASGNGSIVVTYINMDDSSVTVTVNDAPPAPRMEFILTSTASAARDGYRYEDALRDASSGIPSSLLGQDVFLNGAPLAVDPNTGLLPVFPPAGKVVTDPSQPIVVPGWSLGFIQLLDADVPACA